MATVTGPTMKNKKLDGLVKRKKLMTEEYMASSSEFLELLNKNAKQTETEFLDIGALCLSEGELKQELDATRDAKDSFYRCEALYENRTLKKAESTDNSKEVYRLPRLEIRTFDGEPNNWLPFWHQFKRIHEDPSICAADKLQYLHQCTTGGVRDLVGSYPQLEENYIIILDQIKAKFASNKTLIRYFVKEIIKLVTDNKIKGNIDVIYTSLETKLRALNTLGVTRDKYCDILLPLVEAALPEELLMLWHRYNNMVETQSVGAQSESELDSLLTFLGREVENKNRVKEIGCTFPSRRVSSGPKLEKGVFSFASALVNFSENQTNCIFCDKTNHLSYKCKLAERMDLKERKNIVFKKGACFSCLRKGHKNSQCKLRVKCVSCSGNHAVLLCDQVNDKKDNTVTCLSNKEKTNSSFLPTLLVNVEGNGKRETVRALIDSGCQRSYILEDIAQRLKLRAIGKEVMANCLFGGVVSQKKKYNLYEVVVSDLDEKFSLGVNVLGENVISEFIPKVGRDIVNMFPEVTFSDTSNNLPISLVLGADVFGEVFICQSHICREGFTAMKTKLGWVLTGPRKVDGCSLLMTTCLKNSVLPNLWELDVLGIKDQPENKKRDVLDQETMDHFKRHLNRDQDGRYVVALPWLMNHPELPDNKDIAEKRLKVMTEKLCKNNLVDSYQSVLEEWEELGIIEAVPEDELMRPCHYLAHRPVVRMSKETTKIRPVFDASCAKEGFPSLNDCLSTGPNLLELIIPLLIRFRLYRYGLVADIEKAFLQIGLKEQDRDFLRFLWWKKNKVREEMLVFRHKRLVFGISCSPFLLNATISHHLSRYKGDEKILEVVRKLMSSLYVDDCVVSVSSLEELSMFVNVCERAMSSAHFNLRGWKHNAQEKLTDQVVNETSVLGLLWDLNLDTLKCSFQFEKVCLQKPITKRKLLSLTNKIFDPLGVLSPVSLIPKLLLQQTWKQKIHWDEELPSEIASKFVSWAKYLHRLNECRIPRWLFSQANDWERCSMHIFCDASNAAYAACVYIRAVEDSGVRIQLMLAKSRVSPLKDVSIPRLELLSACIGVRLAVTVQKSLPVKIKTIFWSDSKVALAWIRRKEQWNVFVRNRVNEIRENSEVDSWRYVPGRCNPADLPSRGCNASEFLEKQWWNGPQWLVSQPDEWPQEEGDVDENEVLSERRKGVCLVSVQADVDLDVFIRYFSTYSRIVRMSAWMVRFIYRSRHFSRLRKVKSSAERTEILQQLEKLSGELSTEETILAENRLLKLLQRECLCINDNKMFGGLKLFQDKEGLVRLESRLTLGLDEEYFQKPIVLVDHELVRRLVREVHTCLGHAGVSTTLSRLRERFFVFRGRRLVRHIVKSCVVCRKILAKPFVLPEAPLPVERTARVSAFQVSGVDLSGPLFLRGKGKPWFVVFTCAVYRAVHLELVTSLSTEAFIMALRRFIARRGRIQVLYSDQGTNFVGTNNLLNRLDWNKLKREVSLKRICWRFNPPAAPWWGGWWERLVGIVKLGLKKTLGRAYLSYTELETVLCDLESTINSRPLTYLTEDPKDLSVITPAHFLHDLPSSDLIDLDKIDKSFLGKRIKYVQSVRANLKERFKKEYLADLLNRRSKQIKGLSEIKTGDIVLVKDHLRKRVN